MSVDGQQDVESTDMLSTLRRPDVVTSPSSKAGRTPLRIAIFTNAYPTVSHSFIRNEIAAMERQGVEVVRIAIRSSTDGVVDSADRLEAGKTHAILGGKRRRLIMALAFRLWKAPLRFLSALRLTLSEPQRSGGRFYALAYLVEACRLAEIAESQNIRHIHVHFGTNPAAIARLATKLADLTFSMTVHGPDEFDAPVALHLAAKIADARLTIAVSDYGHSQLMRWASFSDWPRIKVVRCGVGPEFHTGSIVPGGRFSRTFVCVARLSAQKGIPLLLDAAAALARDTYFSLRIIGDGPMRGEITRQITALDLSRHVELLGWQDVGAVRRALIDSRALVLPSFAEGLPIVIMEALALGRPVIATAVAGIPELVDGCNGWLIRAGSVPALVDAMRAALDATPADLAKMARCGRAAVERSHDVDRNAGQLVDFLRSAVS